MIPYPQTLKSKTILGFVISVTVASILIGGLVKTRLLAINLDIATRLPPPSPYWHLFVALTGLVMPLVMRIGYRRQPLVRRLLNAYLFVFLAQIVSELLLTPFFQRGIAVMIGTLYSLFRLVQLGQGQSWIKQAQSPPWLRPYLWGLMVIWAINLGRFILFRWPILLS